MRGRVGNTSYYYLNGQQVARQARNNSNYGDEARRTEAQQSRRALWGNLVNLYKACSLWMPKAFETKERNQSDYNKFMSVNLNSSEVYLTKDEVSQGCAVVDEYIISQGSLAPVQYLDMTGLQGKSTDILCDGVTLATATVGAISQAIIAQNAAYRDKDNIAFIIFENWADGTTYPYVATRYLELTLDVNSNEPFSGHPLANYLAIASNNNALEVATYLNVTARAVGWACIHTRQEGILKVSSQAISLQKPIIKENYITLVKKQAAIASYGVDEQVPLEPSFSMAVIDSVAVDGSEVLGPNGGNLTYDHGIEIIISGRNLNSSQVRLVHDGIVYTPLTATDEEMMFVLGSNGTNIIYVGGSIYGTITIENATLPAGFPTTILCTQMSASEGPSINTKTVQNADCLNYPYVMTESYPKLYVLLGDGVTPMEMDESDLEGVRCDVVEFAYSGNRIIFKVANYIPGEPLYVKYQGYIILVANYSE